MQGFVEFSEEKKITIKTKMGGEIPGTIKVTGKDYHIVKTDSGKQYKVDHQGNAITEDVDLTEWQTETPWKKTKTDKPAADGGKHSVMSKARHLARMALKKEIEKEKEVKEESQIDEKNTRGPAPGWMLKQDPDLKKKVDDNKAAYKALKKYAGKELPKNEEAELQESQVNQPGGSRRNYGDSGDQGFKSGVPVYKGTPVKSKDFKKDVAKAFGKILSKEEAELQESSDSHKVMVTVSDPNHTAVSQRKEQIMKHVIVRAGDKGEAQAKAESFYKKKGYKVHGSEYHSKQPATSMKTEGCEE